MSNAILAENRENSLNELGKSKTEPTLSREQRRKIERIESNAKNTVMVIGEKFQSFLLESESLNDELITQKIQLLDKQWKFSCRLNHLNEEVHDVVSKHLDAILKEFNKQ